MKNSSILSFPSHVYPSCSSSSPLKKKEWLGGGVELHTEGDKAAENLKNLLMVIVQIDLGHHSA
jgi:hypothetical protein